MKPHDEFVVGIINSTDKAGRIKSRERHNLEYKKSFGIRSWPKYAKTMAAFSNNQGGGTFYLALRITPVNWSV